MLIHISTLTCIIWTFSSCKNVMKKISKMLIFFRILQSVLLGRSSMKGLENSYKITCQCKKQKCYWLYVWSPANAEMVRAREMITLSGENVFYLLFQIKKLLWCFTTSLTIYTCQTDPIHLHTIIFQSAPFMYMYILRIICLLC